MIALSASGNSVFTARILPPTMVVATRPPSKAGATLSGWLPASTSTANAKSSSLDTAKSRARSNSLAATRPPTTAVALLPRPHPGGISMIIRIRSAGNCACFRSKSKAKARKNRLSGPVERLAPSAPSTSIEGRRGSSPLSSMTKRLYSRRANPRLSNPGPRLADVAGVKTVTEAGNTCAIASILPF